MAGLIQLSCEILESMIKIKRYVPSSIAYIAVLNGLRKVKKLSILRETMASLSIICKENNQSLDTVALNTYLGALCDASLISSSNSTSSDLIAEAVELLRPNVASDLYAIHAGPDTISYNTVLTSALTANGDNTAAVAEIMSLMKSNYILDDIYTYNLRLKACGNGPTAIEKKIDIIDEILAHPIINPDKFTIEQILLPLAKKGRIGDILEVLKDFNAQQESEISVSNAYSTFLIALVKVSKNLIGITR